MLYLPRDAEDAVPIHKRSNRTIGTQNKFSKKSIFVVEKQESGSKKLQMKPATAANSGSQNPHRSASNKTGKPTESRTQRSGVN